MFHIDIRFRLLGFSVGTGGVVGLLGDALSKWV
jgi:hypothetical protein